MSYPHQDTVMKRLQDKSYRALRASAAIGAWKLSKCWNIARHHLRVVIATKYAPSTAAFNRNKLGLQLDIRQTLQRFGVAAADIVRTHAKDLHKESVLRHAWILDQVTPECTKIKLPLGMSMREAEVFEDPTAFEDRWNSWLEAYNSALVHNLTLNAINEGDITSAMDEVGATKANTPAYTLIDAMNRIYEYEAMDAINQGAEDIGIANEDSVEEEIWRTRGDLRVCDDCDANEGQSIEDVGFPPLHPNCHCFTELVPSSFADLLRSGDAEDWDLAQQMDTEGLAPNAMVIRNENGDVAAKLVVDFEKWVAGNDLSVTGR